MQRSFGKCERVGAYNGNRMRVGAIVMLLGLCVPPRSVAQDAPRPVPGAPGRINWRRIEDEDRRGTKKDSHTAAELADVYLASVAE